MKAAFSSIKLDDYIVPVDATLIYQQMIINIKSDNDRRNYLSFELAPFPLSLFKDGLIRAPNKADLYEHFDESFSMPIENI